MTSFDFLTAGRIRFGRGQAASAGEAVIGLGTRVVLVRGRSVPWVSELSQALVADGCTVSEVLSEGEPTLDAVEKGCLVARGMDAQVVVAIGGGATVDLGKAIAALTPASGPALQYLEGVGDGASLDAAPLPFVAVPTTAGTGAEVTKNAVIAVPSAGRKVSLRDDRMLPDIAIVDPALTDGAPREVTLASGLDALTQVIEPFLTPRANPLTDALVRSAIPQALDALPRLAAGEDRHARDTMCFVSLCGGLALANAGLGAVHGLAGVIGGRLGAPHGLICGRLLGPVLAANHAMLKEQGSATDRFDELSALMADAWDLPRDDPFTAIGPLLDSWRLPRLSRWMPDGVDLKAIADEAATSSSMKANPCILPQTSLVAAMRAAS